MVQTAASVDGYTDNVSVVLRDGVKRTIPSRWPDVVVADVTTISTAPRELNTAGYGEVLSMLTAPADWYLASRARHGPDLPPGRPGSAGRVRPRPRRVVTGVAQGDLESIGQLTRMLAVRGVATGVAGTTACLSGVEHLVSHMLDMHNGAHGRPIGLHGAQVGVASVVAAAAWEHLFAVFDPADRAAARCSRTTEAIAPDGRRARRLRRPRPVAARVGAECWRDYSAKLAPLERGRDTVRPRSPTGTPPRRPWTAAGRPDDAGHGLVAAGAAARFDRPRPAVDRPPPAGRSRTATSCATASPSSTCSTCSAGGPPPTKTP